MYGGMRVNVVYEVVVVAIVIDLGSLWNRGPKHKGKKWRKGEGECHKAQHQLRINLQTSHLRFRLQKSSILFDPSHVLMPSLLLG
jgi:hypothetical protein